MDNIISCEFNIDTGCVELLFADGSTISIDCTAVEDESHTAALTALSWTG